MSHYAGGQRLKIAIGSDHAGYPLKEEIMKHLKNHEIQDMGTHSTDSCDYPDCIAPVGEAVRDGNADLGIVICGSGIGASLVANKIHGIRAALCFNSYMAEMSRKHNNANVLALGARVIGLDVAFHIVDTWLATDFEGGRHQRRVEKIHDVETRQCRS
jgi:ribose 5-phosphate isomerase B